MTDVINLENGHPAPNFSATDSEGNMYDLSDLTSSGRTVILYFYPKDDTPGCTIQACDFRDNMLNLNDSNTVVLGVSKDSATSHDNFTEKFELNFPLLMDEDLALHTAYGTWREKQNYGRTYMGCVRSTFIIDTDGTISHAMYNVKAKGHVERIMSLLGK